MAIKEKNFENSSLKKMNHRLKPARLKSFWFSAAFFLLGVNIFAAKISVGAAPLFALGLGTQIMDSQIKAEVSVAERSGFSTEMKPCGSVGVNVFARYQLPFFEKLGIQADFSYLNANGFTQKIDSVSYKYSYKSLEISPLAVYGDRFRLFSWSCFLGPNFSFPLGGLDYEFDFISDEKKSVEIKTVCTAGISAGASAGISLGKAEVFALAKYLCDFQPVVAEINSESDFMVRRCLVLGLGARYIF